MPTEMLLALLLTAQAVDVEIDGSRTHPISPFVYGINHPNWKEDPGLYTTSRAGGNRLTCYNWETNASNAGSDWHHQNDNLMGSDVVGEPIRATVQAAFDQGAACVVTVPLIGYVAADKKGGGDVKQTPDHLKTRFFPSLPEKGAPFADPPDLADGKVFQDEFVAWLEKRFPRGDARKTIWYALDNEPDLWSHTHARAHPGKVRFDELIDLNVRYATAIKKVAPKALVFGFVSYGWHGFTTLQDAPDRAGRNFLDVYLAAMKAAADQAGKPLVDVLDLHFYPEARGGKVRVMEDSAAPDVAAARIQSTRSLWDPTYKENSWIANSINGPIRLLPRVKEQIAKHAPGMKLAMTEYYYGGGADISGGIAQADVLGILGREGVFAAHLWHMGRTDDRFIRGAFRMFRDVDGKGARLGETGLAVAGGDPAKLSVYAALDASKKLGIVAINKTAEPIALKLAVKGTTAPSKLRAWRLTSADPRPVSAGEVGLSLEIPPLSVTTLLENR